MTAPQWGVYLDGPGGTREPELVTANVVDTSNPFGNYALAEINDVDGERYNAYSIYQDILFRVFPQGVGDPLTVASGDTYTVSSGTTEEHIEVNVGGTLNVAGTLNVGAAETIDRFPGFVADIEEQEQGAADRFVVEAHSYDQYLRGEVIDEDLSGSTIFDALNTIITTYTPVTWNASNVEVGDNQELTQSFRGEKVEDALLQLSFKSVSEEFGVNRELEFFFRPLEADPAPNDLGGDRIIAVDEEEDGRAAPNEVTVFFDGGDRQVTVSLSPDKLDRQDAVGTDRPVTKAVEITREDITDIGDAEDAGRRYLNEQQSKFLADVTTVDLYDGEIGDVIGVESQAYDVHGDFRIAGLEYVDAFETVVSIVDRRKEQDQRLVNFGETLDRVEQRPADRDSTKNTVLDANATALFGVTADVGGTAFTESRFVNSAREKVRDAWRDPTASALDITHIAVGTDASGLNRTNTALQNETEREAVGETLDGSFAVDYDATFASVNEDLTFSDTGETGQNVDVTNVDEVTVELWGPGGADGDGNVDTGSGAPGGYIKATIDTSSIDTLEVFPGEQGSAAPGGVGLYDGGQGGQNLSTNGGGGGASTSIRDGDGNELLHSDGGGGGGASGENQLGSSEASGGGGGARGGSSGTASSAVNTDDGQNGEGTGNGGDGGDATSTTADDGADGGTEIIDSNVVTEVESTTGGGNDGDGRVVVTDAPANTSEVALFDTDGDLVCRVVNADESIDLDGTATVSIEVLNDDSVAKGLLTDTGRTTARDIVADNSPDRPNKYGYGDDGTEPVPGDTALGNQLIALALDEVLIQDASTTTDWDRITDIGDTDPLSNANDQHATLQTAHVQEGVVGAGPDRDGYGPQSDADYSDGEAGAPADLDGGYVQWHIEPTHDIPSENVAIQVRDDVVDSGTIDADGARWIFNGLELTNVSGNKPLGWVDLGSDFYVSPATTYDDLGGDDLEAGESYVLRFEWDSDAGTDINDYRIDVVCVYDDRFNHSTDGTDNTFDNSNDGSGGFLDSPCLYPAQVESEFAVANTRRTVTEADIASEWVDDNVANDQAWFVKNSDTEGYLQTDNSETASETFASPERNVQVKARLSRYGSRSTATPQTGFNGQAIDSYELTANPDAFPASGPGEATVRAIAAPGDLASETLREAGVLTSTDATLTRSVLAALTVGANERIISAETNSFDNA